MENNPIINNDVLGLSKRQVVNEKGEVIYDDKKDDGNIHIASKDGEAKIKALNNKSDPASLKTIEDNSKQVVSDGRWLGTESELKDFVNIQYNPRAM